MYLMACIVLSTLLTNPSIELMDSLNSNSIADIASAQEVGKIVHEVTTINGAKVSYIRNTDVNQDVWVRFDFGILFPSGESSLNDGSKESLTKLSDILIKNPSSEIVVLGYTDNISSLEVNQKLSERRARAVAGFLISKSVPSAQLKEIAGRNYSKPVADNATSAGRAANRRVEMYFVFKPVEVKSSNSLIVQTDSIKSKSAPASLLKLVNQVIKQPVKSNDVEIEIDGLLVDDTKTKAGKDFYDSFYDSWEAPAAAKNYSITVSEKPFRLTTTMIVISINDNIVYQDILQPRQDLIEAQTEDAISTTQNYLANYEEIQKQLNGDDQSGSGIY